MGPMIRRFLLLSMIAAGCTSPATPPATAAPAVDNWSDWYQCPQQDASITLVTRLTIPGLLNRSELYFPIRRDRIEPPVLTTNGFGIPGGGHGMIGPMAVCADGSNAKGGFGYVGSIGLASDQPQNSQAINLTIDYTWTTADQVHGHLKQTVPVTIGKPADIPLDGGGRLTVDWVVPTPASQPSAAGSRSGLLQSNVAGGQSAPGRR
jgi:hypothetical protein